MVSFWLNEYVALDGGDAVKAPVPFVVDQLPEVAEPPTVPVKTTAPALAQMVKFAGASTNAFGIMFICI